MYSLKIGIVEDEVIIAETILLYLTRLEYNVVFTALSYEEAILGIETQKPDIVLLDINLRTEKSGIDLGAVLNQKYKIPFIFLSANSDSATLQKAKLVKPLAFLVKPFSQNGLYTSIEIAMDNFQAFSATKELETDYLLVNIGKKFSKIPFHNIYYLENNHIYIDIYLVNGSKETIRGSFTELLTKLPRHQFTQISRSHIINHQFVTEMNNETVLIGGVHLPISKRKKSNVSPNIK